MGEQPGVLVTGAGSKTANGWDSVMYADAIPSLWSAADGRRCMVFRTTRKNSRNRKSKGIGHLAVWYEKDDGILICRNMDGWWFIRCRDPSSEPDVYFCKMQGTQRAGAVPDHGWGIHPPTLHVLHDFMPMAPALSWFF